MATMAGAGLDVSQVRNSVWVFCIGGRGPNPQAVFLGYYLPGALAWICIGSGIAGTQTSAHNEVLIVTGSSLTGHATTPVLSDVSLHEKILPK